MGQLVAILVVAAAVGSVRADPASDAAAHNERALRLYNTQDYDAAIKEWRESYVLVPGVDTLFAIGQAQRLKGDCKAALITYQTVLRESVSEESTTQIKKVIELCEKSLDDEARHPPAPPAPEQPATIHRPWFTDPLGMTLLGAGIIGTVVGATFFAMGRGAESEADHATNYETFANAAARAHSDRTIAAVGGVIGGALLIGAVIRFATRSDTVEVGATTTAGGATLTLERRF